MGKKIDTNISPKEWIPMKYWSMGSSLSSAEKREKLDVLVKSHAYITSVKKMEILVELYGKMVNVSYSPAQLPRKLVNIAI